MKDNEKGGDERLIVVSVGVRKYPDPISRP